MGGGGRGKVSQLKSGGESIGGGLDNTLPRIKNRGHPEIGKEDKKGVEPPYSTKFDLKGGVGNAWTGVGVGEDWQGGENSGAMHEDKFLLKRITDIGVKKSRELGTNLWGV